MCSSGMTDNRLHHGMTGAELLRLQNPLDGFVRQGGLHLRAAMPVDHIDVCRP